MNKKIVVAKFGSELVTNNYGVDQTRLNWYAHSLKDLHGPDNLIVVTSGAVKVGRTRVEASGQSLEGISDVTLSQLGAATVVSAWEKAFSRVETLAGGLLVTHNELKDEQEGPFFITALKLALAQGIVSVVNENDALSDTELMQLKVGGDNDGLAAHIATLVPAHTLLLYTAKGGIIDDKGNLIEVVDDSNADEVYAMLTARALQKRSGGAGRGGMVTKFTAARRAAKAGVEVLIAKPSPDTEGDQVTRFVIG